MNQYAARLIPTLLDHLFLEPDHPRAAADDSMKASIQADTANCLLQIAVFEPGRQLLASEPAIMNALHALAEGMALTDEARVSANGALTAIDGIQSHMCTCGTCTACKEQLEASGHIMMSCE